jgi:hypothetical protein
LSESGPKENVWLIAASAASGAARRRKDAKPETAIARSLYEDMSIFDPD